MCLSFYKRNTTLLTISFFLFLNFLCSTSLYGASPVSGSFVSVSGNTTVIQLTVTTPPPSALIVEEYFSPGNTVQSTSPTAKKTDSKKGNIKWLFKNIEPGSYTLTTRFNAPLKGSVWAMVKYREPNKNKLIEFRITPP